MLVTLKELRLKPKPSEDCRRSLKMTRAFLGSWNAENVGTYRYVYVENTTGIDPDRVGRLIQLLLNLAHCIALFALFPVKFRYILET